MLETLSAAKKYIVPALEEHCRDILTNHLSEDLVWPVYTWSLKEADVMVCQMCREYIGEDIETVTLALQSPNLLTASRETLMDMLRLNHPIKDGEENKKMGSDGDSRGQGDSAESLKQDNGPDDKEKETIMGHKLEELSPVGILISEIELFQACDKWAEAECGRQELKPTGENKRCVLGDCLSLICFRSMLLDDIVNVVSPSGVLTLAEKYALVEHLCGRTASASEPSGKYPIRNQKVLVQIKTSSVPEMPMKPSPFKVKGIRYSLLEIKPRKRLALSKVWCKHPDNYRFIQYYREVSVTDREGCQYLYRMAKPRPLSEDRQSTNLSYIEFEEIQLQVGVKYKVEVEYCTAFMEGQECPSQTLPQSLLDSARLPVEVSLDVLDRKLNCHIVGLTARLI